MKLGRINSIQIEALDQVDKQNGRCIVRSSGPSWYCTLLIPIFLQHQLQNQNNKNSINDLMQRQHQKFQLMLKLNKNYLIQCFNYTYEKHYLKVDQQFYGKTLYSIKSTQITFECKVNIVIKIANILTYLHGNNVCVRTLCPHVISFSHNQKNTQVKLIWLQQAVELLSKNSSTNTLLRSGINPEVQKFIAPEVRLKKSHSFKADVWSLGAIFYKLIFGDTEGIKFQNQTVIVKYPPKFPKFLQDILNSLLQSDQDKRCSLSTCLNYLKPLKQCAQTTQKLIRSCITL